MADLGISIAEKLLEVIGSEIVKEVCDMWSYKSQLEDLKETVTTIKKVFLDAARRKLSNEEEDFIKKLKDAVYDADDLFDEFLTLAELKQLRPLSKSGKLNAKVRCFFSSKNRVGQAYRMSREVKEIKKRLDDIANIHEKFGFKVDHEPISRRREDTCSYVDEKGIIGREKDKEAIVDMLLDPNVHEDFYFVTIVGMGGLGKTALAQLVYNAEKIRQKFTGLRLWVCVSDQDGEQFDVKTILCKILESVTDKKFDRTSSMELVHKQVQERLRGQEYLLVLDDVWNEDRQKWLDLKKFLMVGQGGSRIVVTTRSERTATIIGDKKPAYKLEGLSQDNARHLFNMAAFEEGHELNQLELGEIGRKIAEKCYGIPLALKVIGSLLFGQDISKWQSFEERGLAEINSGDNMIMSILKLSYHNLEPSLKCCFSYCAIFPKDDLIETDRLIGLWIAQGYVVPLDGVQGVEEAAEEHFRILLRRCFFQDVEKDTCGDVKRFKIHDLMHDVAQEVGREEIHGGSSITNNLGDRIRHVYYDGEGLGNIIGSSKVRSIIYKNYEGTLGITRLDNWMYLRVLDLSDSGLDCLPDSIGKLLLLRYLNLACNRDLEVLPDSITKLHNLQTLILLDCRYLRELPKDFGTLVKLRQLDLIGCEELKCMPSDMDKLTSLRVLPYFAAGERTPSERQSDSGLEVLKALSKIKGTICIEVKGDVEVMNDRGGGYIKSMKHLTQVKFMFDLYAKINHEAVMEKMEPPSNLKGLDIEDYCGTTIPRWGRAEDNWAISLPHLVSIKLSFCIELQELPMLSKLPFLKSLSLSYLENLEYMEMNTSSSAGRDPEDVKVTTFFPSLEYLRISSLGNLRGWWKGKGLVDDDDLLLLRRRFQFPRLLKLRIERCPNLTSLPPCPSLENLRLYDHNELSFSDDDNGMPSFHQSLRFLELTSLRNATCLPKETQYLTSLQTLKLSYCDDISVLPEWINCLSSLQSLYISRCAALKSLPDAMQNLTSLQRLEMSDCPELEERCKETNGEDWPKIKHIPTVYVYEIPVSYMEVFEEATPEFSLEQLTPASGGLFVQS